MTPRSGQRSSLDESGWAILFPSDGDAAVRRALEPLLALRERQAGRRFRVLEGSDGFRGEPVSRFLSRLGVVSGTVNPERLPYYILVAGSPQEIPFGVERQLASTYAVGRVYFDEVDAYQRYATRVARTECDAPPPARRAILFATRHAGDASTEATAHFLCGVVSGVAGSAPEWEWKHWVGDEATRARLIAVLEECPALQIVAAHSALLEEHQPAYGRDHGAIVCGDWAGPAVPGPISRDALFGADDARVGVQRSASIALLWASCSAGVWPGWEGEESQTDTPPQPIPRIGALPQRLLSEPGGGPLAILGFLDRIAGHPVGRGSHVRTFADAATLFIRGLVEGRRVGDAMRAFSVGLAGILGELARTIERVQSGAEVPDAELAVLWLAMHDLRSLTLLGDPAVRLTTERAT